MDDNDEYKILLQKQFKKCLVKIEEIRNKHSAVPVDVFLYKLTTVSIKTELDNIEWLEKALNKLTASLEVLQKYDDREEYKKIVGADLASKMKYL